MQYAHSYFKRYLQQTAAVGIALVRHKGQRCRYALLPPRNRDEVLSGKPLNARNDVVFRNVRAIHNRSITLGRGWPSEVDDPGQRGSVRTKPCGDYKTNERDAYMLCAEDELC